MLGLLDWCAECFLSKRVAVYMDASAVGPSALALVSSTGMSPSLVRSNDDVSFSNACSKGPAPELVPLNALILPMEPTAATVGDVLEASLS